MLVNIHHDTGREHLKLAVSGVAFLTTIAILIGLSIAIYDKAFDRGDMITIHADRAGLQLNKFGDVRLRGVLVGQVRSISEQDNEAVIQVSIQPDEIDQIPANTDVQILPTTLFGQKFISFVAPSDPSSQPLQAGDVIPADRVSTNVELSEVLTRLFPLLRAVRPADLNRTLNALATALEGRGEELGQTLDDLDTYLHGIRGSLPTLKTDLTKLADVAHIYDVAAPDLLRTLGNLTVTSHTIIEKKQQLDAFFTDLTGLSDDTTRLLQRNGTNLIRSGQVGAPVLKLLATYSPEFPCLIEGAALYQPKLASGFSGNQIKQYIEFGTNQYRHYDQRDLPEYGEVGHGPWCDGLPHPQVPIGPVHFKDGTDIDEGQHSPLPGAPSGRTAPVWARQSGFGPGMDMGLAGTAGDTQVIDALIAGRTGRPATSYGSLGPLLYGPVVRGGAR